jgi:hypothetical protein
VWSTPGNFGSTEAYPLGCRPDDGKAGERIKPVSGSPIASDFLQAVIEVLSAIPFLSCPPDPLLHALPSTIFLAILRQRCHIYQVRRLSANGRLCEAFLHIETSPHFLVQRNLPYCPTNENHCERLRRRFPRAFNDVKHM